MYRLLLIIVAITGIWAAAAPAHAADGELA